MLLSRCSLVFLERKFRDEQDVRVRERLQMLLYLREGRPQREVSGLLKVSTGLVPYWKERFERDGIAGLHNKPGKGRKPLLKKKDLKRLEAAIDIGVLMPDGYRRGYKTKDVRAFIQQKFNTTYTPRHCARLLHSLDYNLKVPRPKNKRRNQIHVEAFKRAFKKNEFVWEKNTPSSHTTKQDSLLMPMYEKFGQK